MTDSIEKVRMAIADESLPDVERRELAEHLIELQIAAVTAEGIQSDDPEVITLMQPWDNTALAASAAEATGGRSVNGWCLKDARTKVLERHRLRVLLSTICDDAAHHLERLAACTVILDGYLPIQGKHRRGGYTPEKLLSEVLPTSATKWKSAGRLPVQRPPRSYADVWVM
jgi:hypothetical protein